MVSLKGDGRKDQLKSVSIGIILAKDFPRLTWCDDRDSQEQVSGECQNGLLVLNGACWGRERCNEIRDMGCSTQHWAASCPRGDRAWTRKTGSYNHAIGCWLVPSTCMLEKGGSVMWVEIEVQVVWGGHISCSRGCQCMYSII